MVKWMTVAAALFAALGIGAAVGRPPAGRGADAKAPPDGEKKPKGAVKEGTVADVVGAHTWTLMSVNTRKGLVSLCEGGTAGDPGGAARLQVTEHGYEPCGLVVSDLPATEAEVSLDGKPAKLADLKPDMAVTVQLAKGSVKVTKITALSKSDLTRPSIWKVKVADPKQNTVTVTSAALGLTLKNLAVTEGTRAKVAIPIQANAAPKFHPLDLETLKTGASVGLEFRYDAKTDEFVLGSILTIASK